jgi:hypothetical protein
VTNGGLGVERLDIAGLGLEFHSPETQPLLLLRNAAMLPPGFAGTKDSKPAVTVDMRLTGELAYQASSISSAHAQLSSDAETLPLHLSAICRAAMSQALSHDGGALVHAAAAVIDGQATLLVAPSEGGKTTLSGMLASERVPILSDETIALRATDKNGRFNAHGTFFWSGPVLPTLSGGWPLRCVALLEQGPLGIDPLPVGEALGRFLREWHVAEDEGAASRALAVATNILEHAPAYRLSFRLSDSPASLIRLLQSVVPP